MNSSLHKKKLRHIIHHPSSCTWCNAKSNFKPGVVRLHNCDPIHFDFVLIKNSFFPCLLEHVFPDSTPSSLMTSYVSFVDSFISTLFLVIRQGRDNLTTVLCTSFFIMSLDGEKKILFSLVSN